MARKRTSWLEDKAVYPALMPVYTCPCCGASRQSVQYGDADGFQCAQCAWEYCGGDIPGQTCNLRRG
jgi:hypothetical protein